MLCGACLSAHAQSAHFAWAQSIVLNGLFSPQAVAVDGSGNIYIADTYNEQVLKVTLSDGGYTQSVVATSAANGLNRPYGVAVDASGNVYIADYENSRVLKETLSAGSYTQSVVANAASQSLSYPGAVAVDGNGNVYIDDWGNSRVLKETLSAGAYTQSVVINYVNNGQELSRGVAVDLSGNVYIADYGESQVLKETPSTDGYVQSVVANSAINGLNGPHAVAVDGSGDVYIGDSNNERVLKESFSAGSYTQSVVANHAINDLEAPVGVAADGSGNIYITDFESSRVLKESSSGGNFGTVNVGSTNPTPISVIFAFDTAGTLGSTAVVTEGVPNLDFTDAGSGTCKAGTAYTAGQSCTVDVSFKPKFAGTRYGAAELLDGSGNVLAIGYVQGTGVGPQVTFLPGTQSVVANAATNGLDTPQGIAVDGGGNIYIADSSNNQVLKETLSAGSYNQSVVANAANGLKYPVGVAVDASGNVYIADPENGSVLKETRSSGGYTQSVVANAANNGLSNPQGVAVDGGGNLYIADWSINQVLKETPSAGGYTQSVVAGSATGGLMWPTGVAVDGSGNVYIADWSINLVLKETFSAGSYTQSIVASSGLNEPYGVAVDGSGNVYIADYGSNRVLKETPWAGNYTESVVANYANNGLLYPGWVALDGSGNVFIPDSDNNRVLKEDFADPPSLTFAQTAVGSTSSDSPQTITLVNDGNAALSFPIPSTGNNPSISTNFTLNSSVASACTLISSSSSSPGALAAGESCLLPISFSPTVVGSLSGPLVLTDNALNISGSTQSIPLSGTGVSPTAVLTSPTPGSTLTGTSIKFTWSAVGGVSAYDLHLSAVAPGGYDLYVSGHITGTSVTVNGLPSNGETIYARLYSIINGATVYNDYTFKAMSVLLATLTSPAPSSTLTSNSVKFTWSAGSAVSQYDLHLSAVAPGGYDLYLSGHITGTSTTATGLPTNGEKIYARLYTILNGVTFYNDYTYTAISVSSAKVTSPAPSSTLTSNSVSFTWSAGTAGSQYDLHLSAVAPGGFELYFSGHIAGTSTTVNGLPTNGEKIYARLYTIVNGVTVYIDSTYTAASIAKLLSPAPSSTLTATSVKFTWSAGTAVSQYDLHLSAVAPGGYDLYFSGHRAGTSATATGLPTNGETIYARLYTILNGVTLYNDYVYKAQ
jgi:sugar lactone lactonase YvrE